MTKFHISNLNLNLTLPGVSEPFMGTYYAGNLIMQKINIAHYSWFIVNPDSALKRRLQNFSHVVSQQISFQYLKRLLWQVVIFEDFSDWD